MQVHGPNTITDQAKASLNDHNPRRPFAVLDIGHVSLHVHALADADTLIRAAAEVKRLLLGEPPENAAAIAMSAFGPAEGDAS